MKNLSDQENNEIEFFSLAMQGWKQDDLKISWDFARPKIRRKSLPNVVKKQLAIGLTKADSILIEISEWDHYDNSEEVE